MGRGLYNYSNNFRMHSREIADFLLDSIDRSTLIDAIDEFNQMEADAANGLNRGYIAALLNLTPSKFYARFKKTLKTQPDIPELTVV